MEGSNKKCMNIKNVLVPGGGGASGIGTIKSLQKGNFKGKIVTTDSDSLAAGFKLADKGYVLPLVSSKNYWKEVQKVLRKEKIEFVFPSSGFETREYAKHKEELAKKGVTVFCSDSGAIETADDKWKFYEAVKNNFPVPKTTKQYTQLAFPMIAKPIRGKGSKGVRLCHNKHDILSIADRRDYIFQEYLPGKEYTVDVLSDFSGKALCAVPRKRLEIKAGISFKGEVVANKKLEKLAKQVCEYCNMVGQTFVQVREDKNGDLKIIEIEPRSGGGTFFTTLAGVNMSILLLRLAEGKKINIPKPKHIKVSRYYNEAVFD